MKIDKNEIKKFFGFIDSTESLGLIIFHNPKDFTKGAKKITSIFKKPKAEFEIKEDTSLEDFMQIMQTAFASEKSLFLKIKTPYLPGAIYNQLRLLSTVNRIDPNVSGDLIEKPKSVDIISFWANEDLENCHLPNILDLFGGVNRIYK